MDRALVFSAGLVLALVAAFAQALAGPLPALACSCMEPLPGMDSVASQPDTVVLVGTIGQQTPERTPVAVDTWFHGPGISDVVWLSFGTQAMTSCDPFVTPGERRLLVLHRQEDGTFGYSPCVASGVIGTPAGDEAFAEATELFVEAPVRATPEPTGPTGPTGPPEPTEQPATPTPAPDGAAQGWVFVAGALGAALLIFGAVALFALRRQPR